MWKWLFLALIIIVWRSRVKQKKNQRISEDKEPRLIDVKALSDAEVEVASQDIQGWKIIETYESGQGYNASDLVSVITYLGNNGVQATFNKTGVGIEGGAITTFVLKVPVEDVEKAKELLRLRPDPL